MKDFAKGVEACHKDETRRAGTIEQITMYLLLIMQGREMKRNQSHS